MRTLLHRLHAPGSLISWLEECADDPDPPWESCGRPDWALWIAACQGADFASLLGATLDCVRISLNATVGPTQFMHQVLETIENSPDAESCDRAATLCQRAAEQAPTSYRSGPGKNFELTVSAIEMLLRAAEMLCALRARRRAEVQLEALHRAGGIGVPPAMMEPLDDIAVRLEPHRISEFAASSDEVAFLASLSEAVRLAAAVLSHSPDAAPTQEITEALADSVYERLYST